MPWLEQGGVPEDLRERMARAEEEAGNPDKADEIRLGDSVADDVLSARYNFLEMWSDDFYDFIAFDIEFARATSEKGGSDHKSIEPTIDFILKTFGDWEE